MDSSNHDAFVAVSHDRVQAHLRREVAKRIDRLMQETRLLDDAARASEAQPDDD